MADLERQRLNLRTILTTFQAAMDSPAGRSDAARIVASAHELLDDALEHPTGPVIRAEIEAVRATVEATAQERRDVSG